jgi:hypothetical protein
MSLMVRGVGSTAVQLRPPSSLPKMPSSVTSAQTDPGAEPAMRVLTRRPAGMPVAGCQRRPSSECSTCEEPSPRAATATKPAPAVTSRRIWLWARSPVAGQVWPPSGEMRRP